MQNNYLCVKADMDRPRNIFNFGGCRETGSRFAKMSISCPTFFGLPIPVIEIGCKNRLSYTCEG